MAGTVGIRLSIVAVGTCPCCCPLVVGNLGIHPCYGKVVSTLVAACSSCLDPSTVIQASCTFIVSRMRGLLGTACLACAAFLGCVAGLVDCPKK